MARAFNGVYDVLGLVSRVFRASAWRRSLSAGAAAEIAIAPMKPLESSVESVVETNHRNGPKTRALSCFTSETPPTDSSEEAVLHQRFLVLSAELDDQFKVGSGGKRLRFLRATGQLDRLSPSLVFFLRGFERPEGKSPLLADRLLPNSMMLRKQRRNRTSNP